MRNLLLSILLLAMFPAFAQRSCPQNSILYHFEKDKPFRNFTQKLGNHPQFEFLQKANGVNSPAAFIKAINDPGNQQKYEREFRAFDLLLHNSGFDNGYKDLNENNVENIYVIPGTIGNLGFYDKVKDRINYIYVKLNPAGEELAGVAAWKLTNDAGCYLYILHTCGNAFYPNTNVTLLSATRSHMVLVQSQSLPVKLKTDTFTRTVHITVNYYQARISATKDKHKSGSYDTATSFVHRLSRDTTFTDQDGKEWQVFARSLPKKFLANKDTSLMLYSLLHVDSVQLAGSRDSLEFTFSDTAYLREPEVENLSCGNKWEITLEGGLGRNSVPTFNSAVHHSQSNGFHPAAEFTFSRIFNQWFQLGLSASYVILSYQDDFPYVGATPGTYSQVYLGNPIFPVQLFVKANIGKELGWQSSVALSGGYAIPGYQKITNSGFTLNATPGVKGGPTAGVRLGLAYFFSCKFGLGLTVSGQYFNISATQQNFQLFSQAITGGLRIRF
jgi:hypothetical protein